MSDWTWLVYLQSGSIGLPPTTANANTKYLRHILYFVFCTLFIFANNCVTIVIIMHVIMLVSKFVIRQISVIGLFWTLHPIQIRQYLRGVLKFVIKSLKTHICQNICRHNWKKYLQSESNWLSHQCRQHNICYSYWILILCSTTIRIGWKIIFEANKSFYYQTKWHVGQIIKITLWFTVSQNANAMLRIFHWIALGDRKLLLSYYDEKGSNRKEEIWPK